jgi:hypothetical protein
LEITESPADLWRTIPFFLKVFIVANCTYSLLALLGALLALHAQKPLAQPLATVLVVYPVIFYITHSGLRYRFPIDPLMVVFAVYAISCALSLAKGRRGALLPQTAATTADQPL